MKLNLLAIALIAFLVTSCASEEIKAPCDQYASFCGSKTKINHW